MKTTLSALLALFTLSVSGAQLTNFVTFNWLDFGASLDSVTNRPVKITPLEYSTFGSFFMAKTPRIYTNTSAGVCVVTNMQAGSYRVELATALGSITTFTSTIPITATGGTNYEATQFVTNYATNSGSTRSYSITVSDLRYPSVAGTNILFYTNAGRVTIAGTATSGTSPTVASNYLWATKLDTTNGNAYNVAFTTNAEWRGPLATNIFMQSGHKFMIRDTRAADCWIEYTNRADGNAPWTFFESPTTFGRSQSDNIYSKGGGLYLSAGTLQDQQTLYAGDAAFYIYGTNYRNGTFNWLYHDNAIDTTTFTGHITLLSGGTFTGSGSGLTNVGYHLPVETLVVIPDTQSSASSGKSNILGLMSTFIITNSTNFNVSMVLGVGDIVNDGDNRQEWTNAVNYFWWPLKTNGLAHLAAIGNHDYTGNQPAVNRNSTNFDEFLGTNYYMSQSWFVGGFFTNGSARNTYVVKKFGGRDTIFFSLEFGMPTNVLDWASGIISNSYPNHVVVVTTHANLHNDGSLGGDRPNQSFNPSTYPATDSGNPNQSWSYALRHWKNLRLIVSGHYLNNGTARRSQVGVNGNVVNFVLANYQTGTDWGAVADNAYMRFMRYNPNQNLMSVETTSPYQMTNSPAYATLQDPENKFGFAFIENVPVTSLTPDNFLAQPVNYSNAVVTATSATNYSLVAGEHYYLHGQNTNANITFFNTRAGASSRLIINNLTGSVVCRVSFPSGVLTNFNTNLRVTNGWLQVFNLDWLDNTATNVLITSGDRYGRQP